MVNAVTGSDFLPSREPVSGSGKNDSTDFRDALQQASKGQKEDSSVKEEASAQGKDAPAEEDGIRPEADGDQLRGGRHKAGGRWRPASECCRKRSRTFSVDGASGKG